MNKLMGLLGLARKAGRVAAGGEAVMDALKHSGAKLVFLTPDASENTAEKITAAATEQGAYILILPVAREDLGHILGKAPCTACAVTDVGFAAELAGKLATLTGSDEAAEAARGLSVKRTRRDERRARAKGPPAAPPVGALQKPRRKTARAGPARTLHPSARTGRGKRAGQTEDKQGHGKERGGFR